MKNSLQGLLAVVTGASGGIGAGIAEALAKKGASVIVHYHQNEKSAATVAQRCKEYGTFAAVEQADLRSAAEVSAMFSRINQNVGIPTILVHNAGIAHSGLLTDISESQWDDVVSVHIKGAFHCTRCVLPAMARTGFGRILLVGSVWGEFGAASEVAYSTAKGALTSFARATAQEWGSAGITVNVLSPGAVQTPMLQGYSEEELDAIRVATPVGRLGTPADIGHAAAFLAARESSFITGQVLTCDGGWMLT